MKQPHTAGQCGGEANREWLAEKDLGILVDQMWDMKPQCALAAKAASSTLSCGSVKQRQKAERYENVSGALCPLLDSTVHQQTELSTKEATEMVRELEQQMYGERLRTGFVQHGEGKASEKAEQKGRWSHTPQWYTVMGSRHQLEHGKFKLGSGKT